MQLASTPRNEALGLLLLMCACEASCGDPRRSVDSAVEATPEAADVHPPATGPGKIPVSDVLDPAAAAASSLDDLLASAPEGSLVYDAPEFMNLHASGTVRLLVAAGDQIEELERRLEAQTQLENESGGGDFGSAQVKITKRMQARLTGTSFEIQSVTPSRQAVASGEPTEWRWQIQPKSSGHHFLHLSLSAIFEVEGESTPRTMRTFYEPIEVEVTIGQRVSEWIANHWQWAWAFLLLPLGAWAKRRWFPEAKPSGGE